MNFNFKSPSMIVIYSLTGICILCFCLMNFSDAFAIIASICLFLIFSIATFKTWINYLIYKRQLADQRLSDAYLYAEEIGDEEAISDFTYPKKVERKIRYEKFNHFLVPFAFLLLAILSIFLFLICTRII